MAYNFTLGGLGFHKLINDEHPYERATAPFRKDQLDTAPIVGDQSLSGWWTRGQMSFHRGAGVRYYELLDGEEVLNRYDTSENVNPWEPGELTLGDNLATVTLPSGTMVKTMTSGEYVGGSTWGTLVLLSDGTVRELNGSTFGSALAVPGSPTLQSVTSAGQYGRQYVASDTQIFYKDDWGGAPFTLLWTADSAASISWSGIYWAKNRLWIKGWTGSEWYTAAGSGAGGTVTTTDRFWQSTSGETLSCLAESPSVVYLAGDNKIYSVALDDTGAVPVTNSPTVAAILPVGEEIYNIAWYLGRLVIATNLGIRVAEQLSDGRLVYGPLVVEGYFRRMLYSVGGYGDLLYVIGITGSETTATTATIYAINMADNADDLLPAYTPVRNITIAAGSGNWSGTAVTPDGVLYAWTPGGGLVRDDGTLPTSGTLTTGFHRLGTLDLKSFRHLKVKVTGSGSVQVSVILPNGTTTSVGTVTSSSGELDLSAAVTSPQEAVAFKFTLLRATSTTGPTLLGYQLKALPMPKRQRLIRVPLMMFDTERGPTGRALGAEKSAWTRYRALEALEESNALVSYTDSDTGDSGTAYIESVELMQRNGSKGVSRSNGFGGVVTVTLRKVA